MTIPDRRRQILDLLYGSRGGATSTRLEQLLRDHRSDRQGRSPPDETDAWLITYPDQFQVAGEPPLRTLLSFVDRHFAPDLNGIHILPFYPWSSDDGFAVDDPSTVRPEYGTWEDIEAIASRYRLAVDAVINHLSAESTWFRGFLSGDQAFDGFFLEVGPNSNLTSVVRPRTSPLVTTFPSTAGDRHVWTTFSANQVDLDYHNPEVLLAVIRLLLDYASHGATVIRLDAIGFLWKEPGTTCMSLPQTHAIVELIRSCLDTAYPGTLILTETNVPHTENVSYFGTQSHPEAHIVYQFTLAPLVLHAFNTGDASALSTWAASLEYHQDTAFLNFLASHDGVGLRPAEGILASGEIDALCDLATASGGAVGKRTLPDGADAPYELNATWFDLLAVGHDEAAAMARHLASHAIMLALRGIPATYVHSFFGTGNDVVEFERTGQRRSLNRRKFLDVGSVERHLRNPASRASRALSGLRTMLEWRREMPAFHPGADQQILDTPAGLVGIERQSRDGKALVLVNVTAEAIDVRDLTRSWPSTDAPSVRELGGWQSLWLRSE